MEREIYKKIVDKHKPKEDTFKNELIAFLVGGLVGVLAQVMTDIYSYILNIPSPDASTFTIVTIIFIGCLLTCLGFFDNIVRKCGAGLIVPITGFAHSMMSAALEFRKEGLINGIGANMFKLAGSVIVYGVVSAYIFGLIRYLLFGGVIWRLNMIMYI